MIIRKAYYPGDSESSSHVVTFGKPLSLPDVPSDLISKVQVTCNRCHRSMAVPEIQDGMPCVCGGTFWVELDLCPNSSKGIPCGKPVGHLGYCFIKD